MLCSIVHCKKGVRMNLAYFRKSTHTKDKTIEELKIHAEKLGLTVLGATELPSGNGTILHVCNPNWIGNLIASDKNLIGLLPCAVAVITKGDDVIVGVGSPAVLGGVSQNPAIVTLSTQAETSMKELIHTAAGVGPLKPTHIKLYSTTTCPYCKMEAAWLDSKKVSYDEVHVDQNQAEADDMVKKTGQMGVPVTSVQYEDDEEEFIIGFDKQKLASILGVAL